MANRNHTLMNQIIGRLNSLDLTEGLVSITNVAPELYMVKLQYITLNSKTRTTINSYPEIREISLRQYGLVEIEFNFTELPILPPITPKP